MKLTTHLHLVPKLRISRFTHLLIYVCSWRAQGQIYVFFLNFTKIRFYLAGNTTRLNYKDPVINSVQGINSCGNHNGTSKYTLWAKCSFLIPNLAAHVICHCGNMSKSLTEKLVQLCTGKRDRLRVVSFKKFLKTEALIIAWGRS